VSGAVTCSCRWSYIFAKKTITSKQESYDALVKLERGIPGAIWTLLDEVQVEDFIWLQKYGSFFLCKITDSECVLGPQIADDFVRNDLGHARRAAWVKVSELFVPGRVQRSVIAQRTIQRINCSEVQQQYCGYIHGELSRNPDFLPNADDEEVGKGLLSISPAEFADLLGPDDYEDVVAAFLQAKGWTLIRSSHFKSKPTFEFIMARSGPEYAHVQVKCYVPLRPSRYKEFTSMTERVFLFSTATDPYPGEPVDRVATLSAKEVLEWAGRNTWALLPGVKLQLSLRLKM